MIIGDGSAAQKHRRWARTLSTVSSHDQSSSGCHARSDLSSTRQSSFKAPTWTATSLHSPLTTHLTSPHLGQGGDPNPRASFESDWDAMGSTDNMLQTIARLGTELETVIEQDQTPSSELPGPSLGHTVTPAQSTTRAPENLLAWPKIVTAVQPQFHKGNGSHVDAGAAWVHAAALDDPSRPRPASQPVAGDLAARVAAIQEHVNALTDEQLNDPKLTHVLQLASSTAAPSNLQGQTAAGTQVPVYGHRSHVVPIMHVAPHAAQSLLCSGPAGHNVTAGAWEEDASLWGMHGKVAGNVDMLVASQPGMSSSVHHSGGWVVRSGRGVSMPPHPPHMQELSGAGLESTTRVFLDSIQEKLNTSCVGGMDAGLGMLRSISSMHSTCEITSGYSGSGPGFMQLMSQRLQDEAMAEQLSGGSRLPDNAASPHTLLASSHQMYNGSFAITQPSNRTVSSQYSAQRTVCSHRLLQSTIDSSRLEHVLNSGNAAVQGVPHVPDVASSGLEHSSAPFSSTAAGNRMAVWMGDGMASGSNASTTSIGVRAPAPTHATDAVHAHVFAPMLSDCTGAQDAPGPYMHMPLSAEVAKRGRISPAMGMASSASQAGSDAIVPGTSDAQLQHAPHPQKHQVGSVNTLPVASDQFHQARTLDGKRFNVATALGQFAGLKQRPKLGVSSQQDSATSCPNTQSARDPGGDPPVPLAVGWPMPLAVDSNATNLATWPAVRADRKSFSWDGAGGGALPLNQPLTLASMPVITTTSVPNSGERRDQVNSPTSKAVELESTAVSAHADKNAGLTVQALRSYMDASTHDDARTASTLSPAEERSRLRQVKGGRASASWDSLQMAKESVDVVCPLPLVASGSLTRGDRGATSRSSKGVHGTSGTSVFVGVGSLGSKRAEGTGGGATGMQHVGLSRSKSVGLPTMVMRRKGASAYTPATPAHQHGSNQSSDTVVMPNTRSTTTEGAMSDAVPSLHQSTPALSMASLMANAQDMPSSESLQRIQALLASMTRSKSGVHHANVASAYSSLFSSGDYGGVAQHQAAPQHQAALRSRRSSRSSILSRGQSRSLLGVQEVEPLATLDPHVLPGMQYDDDGTIIPNMVMDESGQPVHVPQTSRLGSRRNSLLYDTETDSDTFSVGARQAPSVRRQASMLGRQAQAHTIARQLLPQDVHARKQGVEMPDKEWWVGGDTQRPWTLPEDAPPRPAAESPLAGTDSLRMVMLFVITVVLLLNMIVMLVALLTLHQINTAM